MYLHVGTERVNHCNCDGGDGGTSGSSCGKTSSAKFVAVADISDNDGGSDTTAVVVEAETVVERSDKDLSKTVQLIAWNDASSIIHIITSGFNWNGYGMRTPQQGALLTVHGPKRLYSLLRCMETQDHCPRFG